MLKIAIIGCGKIADSHAEQIRRIKGCELVGACDREELLAGQLAERFGIWRYFVDPADLLDACRPDVVHITTPPQSHFQIGMQCLDAGCHVYIEKPFTLNTMDAEKLIEIANEKSLKVIVGHNAQFTHAARRVRQLVHSGYLGSPPVHMESTWCYELEDQSYAKALLVDRRHWLRSLPGKLLHNNISHGIARLAEYLRSESPQIIAQGFTSPLLKSMGENDIVDELRVIIREEEGATAYFTFSSQMRPSHHEFRVYGSKNGILLDEDRQAIIKLAGSRYKSYAEHFIPPLNIAKQYLGNWTRNLRLFLRNDFHHDSSMKFLFEWFYRSIIDETPPPIPYREILLTTRIMEKIFEQLQTKTIESSTCHEAS